MAGPASSTATGVDVLSRLQAQGLQFTRIVNTFDIVPWLPAFFYEPYRADGSTYFTITNTGQLTLTAHRGIGYLPAPVSSEIGMDACSQLRALAWVPAIVAATAWALCWLFDDRCVAPDRRRRRRQLEAAATVLSATCGKANDDETASDAVSDSNSSVAIGSSKPEETDSSATEIAIAGAVVNNCSTHWRSGGSHWRRYSD